MLISILNLVKPGFLMPRYKVDPWLRGGQGSTEYSPLSVKLQSILPITGQALHNLGPICWPDDPVGINSQH